MKRILTVSTVLAVYANGACADAIGVKVGAALWNYDIEGQVRYESTLASDDIDANDDLGYDDDDLTFFYVALDHPLPFLPNVKLSRTNIDSDADGRLTRTVSYGGITFVANEDVSSEFKLDQTDVTLYYRILDNVANFDLGLNAKYIDAESTITGSVSGTESADVSGWIPMVYAGVAIDLPLTGLSVGADGSVIGYDDSKFYDYSLHASYSTPWFAGVELGYRSVKLDLDDFDDYFADVEFDGVYAGLYLEF